MEHKLVYCGKCGLEPDVAVEEYLCDEGPGVEYARCPVGHCMKPSKLWNAAQFAARTERINAESGRIWGGLTSGGHAVGVSAGYETGWEHALDLAENLINSQDEAARVRWAEMQKGV